MPTSPRGFTPLFFALCLCLAAAIASAQPLPIRIMPLGDSITDGSSQDTDGYGGYRRPLYYALTAAGYNVDYIGSLTNNGSQIPDPNHEGHSGWRIDQLDTNIAGWFASMADPDVVLMHIGTNDFGQNYSTTTAIDRLDALILKIATLRPYCHIIVTNLMERSGTANTNIQAQFNPFVQARVNAHAAAGRRVTFLDMRSVVPLSDMPDSLHPNQNGYNKMADAWLPAIQAVIGPFGDSVPPAIAGAFVTDSTHLVVTFSKPIEDAAAAVANFAIDGGLTVTSATLDAATKRKVTLTTSQMAMAATYTLSVTGVRDRTPEQNAIAPGSTRSFLGPPLRGAVNYVTEAANYTLVYSLNIPNSASYNYAPPPYEVDNRAGVGPFTRVAYYLELQLPNQQFQYCWVSMNPFTSDPAKLGVPHVNSNAVFQQTLTDMNVFSNVAGVTTGTGRSGNLEFWSTNYTAANSAGIPGASATLYDLGDQPSAGQFGSMQIHDTGAVKSLISFNHWGDGTAVPDVGIGNGTPNPDWTSAANATGYLVRTLQVYVLTASDTTAPVIAAANRIDPRRVTVSFSEPLADSAANVANFSIPGLTITGATLAANKRDVLLGTSPQTAGTSYTVNVSGVRDRSPNANLIAAGASASIVPLPLPAIISANVPEAAGYQLVSQLEIPAQQNGFNETGIVYDVDRRADVATFDRVAYFIETATGGGTSNWIWVSADPFTADANRIGVPDRASGAVFQRSVTGMNVLSNVAGVVTGTGLSGWMEFWPHNYTGANALSVPNASATLSDWGDTIAYTTFGPLTSGSMQMHNPASSQVLFAYNQWGRKGACDLGIGNNPAGGGNPDWTATGNGGTYSTRRLFVLVRPLVNETTRPTIASVMPGASHDRVLATFSEPLDPGAANPANFTIAGLSITAAMLHPNGRSVEIATSAQVPGTAYTLSVSNVADRAGNVIVSGSTAGFTAIGTLPFAANVAETADYTLVQSIALPNTGPGWANSAVTYTLDQRALIRKPFDRVAYYFELTNAGGTKWVYVSADAFTTSIDRIGVPSGPSGGHYQMRLANMNVASNAAGITPVTGSSGGNIEFWPFNYSAPNAISIPNASAAVFDWGDTVTATGTYGSMQIHNNAASQVLFAFNDWGGNGTACDTGIGNNPNASTTSSGGQVDWTFADGASGYTAKNLYVLVRTYDPPAPAAVAPVILSHPGARTAAAGVSSTLSAAASGSGSTFQWRRNGVAIAGATGQTYTIPNAQAVHNATYDLVVTNAAGQVTTLSAQVFVTGLTEDLRSLRIVHDGSGVVLTFTGSPNCPYLVQRSIEIGQWIDLGTVSADASGAVTCADPGTPAGKAFYRLVRVDPD